MDFVCFLFCKSKLVSTLIFSSKNVKIFGAYLIFLNYTRTGTHTRTHRLAMCIGHQLLLLLLLACGQQTCIVCLKKKTGASACRTELLLTPNVVTSGDLTHRTNSAQPQRQPQPPRRAELKLSHRHRVVAMTIDDAAQRRGRR